MQFGLGEGMAIFIIVQLLWVIKKVTRLDGTINEIKRRCPLFKEESCED